jgi:hypothetical protein
MEHIQEQALLGLDMLLLLEAAVAEVRLLTIMVVVVVQVQDLPQKL